MAWPFVLEPTDASSTRLFVRASDDFDLAAVWLLLQFVWRPLHFATERKELLSLRDRSERGEPTPGRLLALGAFVGGLAARVLPGAPGRAPRPAKGAPV